MTLLSGILTNILKSPSFHPLSFSTSYSDWHKSAAVRHHPWSPPDTDAYSPDRLTDTQPQPSSSSSTIGILSSGGQWCSQEDERILGGGGRKWDMRVLGCGSILLAILLSSLQFGSSHDCYVSTGEYRDGFFFTPTHFYLGEDQHYGLEAEGEVTFPFHFHRWHHPFLSPCSILKNVHSFGYITTHCSSIVQPSLLLRGRIILKCIYYRFCVLERC